jgi:hypothetical protein
VLNTLTKHDFQEILKKKKAEALGTVHMRGRRLLRGRWWSVSAKLVFDQMAAPVPEIMDASLYTASSRSQVSRSGELYVRL